MVRVDGLEGIEQILVLARGDCNAFDTDVTGEFCDVDAHFFEFFVHDIFVDVEDDAAEVEDDILDFCAHFCKNFGLIRCKVVNLQRKKQEKRHKSAWYFCFFAVP